MRDYLLDLTTLITLISDICHDSNISIRFGQFEDWKFENKSIYEHIIDEKENPVLTKINEKIKDGKLLTTKPVWEKFTNMINRYGSEDEVERTTRFDIKVIEDDQDQEIIFPHTRMWTEESRSIYGTATKHNYWIVTGNISVLKEALKYNENLQYVAHRSRCFVGNKHAIHSKKN